jgi:hypothetical protein
MTGIGALPDGRFSIMPGSTPFGGQITPLDSESTSLSGARPVVSPERGNGATSGGRSRCVDHGAGPWAYRGEAKIAARIAAATAVLFKLCMVTPRDLLCFFSRTDRGLIVLLHTSVLVAMHRIVLVLAIDEISERHVNAGKAE